MKSYVFFLSQDLKGQTDIKMGTEICRIIDGRLSYSNTLLKAEYEFLRFKAGCSYCNGYMVVYAKNKMQAIDKAFKHNFIYCSVNNLMGVK